MVNQQLVEYVKQQMQGGIGKDAVKKALLDAGWPEGDVNDSLTAAAPAGGASAAAAAPAKPQTINPVAAMGSSSSAPAVMAAPREKYFDDSHAAAEGNGHGSKITIIIMGAVILALLVALGYIYYSLNGKLAAVSPAPAPEAAGGAGNTDLEAQVQKLTADNTGLSTQVASLSADNQDLLGEISFIVPGSTSTQSTTEVKGVLGGKEGAYYFTTIHGIKVTIKNSKDTKAAPVLKPLLGQTAKFKGTHALGKAELTITDVNGAPIDLPPAAATSTASSTSGTAPAANPGTPPPPSPAPPAGTNPPPPASTTITTPPPPAAPAPSPGQSTSSTSTAP